MRARGKRNQVEGKIAPWIIGLLLVPLSAVHGADRYADYGLVPNPAGGDILAVSAAYGPPTGSFWIGAHVSMRSDTLETYRATTLTLLYGLHPRATFGITASHFMQDFGFSEDDIPIKKEGPGDSRVFLKWLLPQTEGSRFAFGLRPSLRIPTGYDREAPLLRPFTTRSLDAELLGIVAYETPNLGIYFNPGISLPGEKWHNEVLGGIGLDVRGGIPLGFTLRGEYATRYDVPDEVFRHEIFAAVGHGFPFGLAVEVGMRKRLLQGEDPGAEMTLRFSRGSNIALPAAILRPPITRTPTTISVAAVSTLTPDPHGLAPRLREAVIRELSRQPGFTATIEEEADFTTKLKIVSISEGNGRSISIPKVLATPRLELEILAHMTLLDAEGTSIVENVPINLRVRRGTGIELFPARRNEDTWVPTAQTRVALRDRGITGLADRAVEQVTRGIAQLEQERLAALEEVF